MLFESVGQDKGVLNAEFAGMGRGTHGKMCCWPLTAEYFSCGHPSEWEGCLLETGGWGQAACGTWGREWSSHKPFFRFPGFLVNSLNIPRLRRQGGGCEKVGDHTKFINVSLCYKKAILMSIFCEPALEGSNFLNTVITYISLLFMTSYKFFFTFKQLD